MNNNKLSLSGLLPSDKIKKLYTIGTFYNEDNIKFNAGSLPLIDIQFIGKRDYDTLKANFAENKLNSIYITMDSKIEKSLKANSKPSIIKGAMMPDDLLFNCDYDFIDLDCNFNTISGGQITNFKRSPLISIYHNLKDIVFVKVMIGNKNEEGSYVIGSDKKNTSNYIIVDDNDSEIYLVHNPSEMIIYKKSYLIKHKGPSNFQLEEIDITNKKSMESIKNYVITNNSENLILNEEDWISILKTLKTKLK